MTWGQLKAGLDSWIWFLADPNLGIWNPYRHLEPWFRYVDRAYGRWSRSTAVRPWH